MRTLFIQWHLGLGDAVLCAAIVAKYAKEFDRVIVPCWPHNKESVTSFFEHISNIEVVEVKNEKELFDFSEQLYKKGIGVAKFGHYSDFPIGNKSFDRWFYSHAGMNVEDRLKYCPLQKASVKQPQIPANKKEFIFIHDCKKRGLEINRELLPKGIDFIESEQDGSILRQCEFLKMAKEIHVIDGPFLHLCESIETTGKLFWHRYARQSKSPENDIYLSKEWKILT